MVPHLVHQAAVTDSQSVKCSPMEGLAAAGLSVRSQGLSLDPTPASQALGRVEGLVPGRLPPGPGAQLLEGSVQTHRPADPRGLFLPTPSAMGRGLARGLPQGHPYRFLALPTPMPPPLATFLLSSHQLPSHTGAELSALPYLLLSTASEEGATADTVFREGVLRHRSSRVPLAGKQYNPKRTPLCLLSP